MVHECCIKYAILCAHMYMLVCNKCSKGGASTRHEKMYTLNSDRSAHKQQNRRQACKNARPDGCTACSIAKCDAP